MVYLFLFGGLIWISFQSFCELFLYWSIKAFSSRPPSSLNVHVTKASRSVVSTEIIVGLSGRAVQK